MSTRASLRELLQLDPALGARVCSICGGDWNALWVGTTEIHVCIRCAVEVLPRLIADATWRRHLLPRDAESIEDQMRTEYWRGIAFAALRAREEDR